MPEFFYLPKEMEYQDYMLDEEAQTAIIRYSYKDQIIYITVFVNNKEISRLAQEDTGMHLFDISSQLLPELKSSLWEIYEDGDKQTTYSLKWNYKNAYYEILGKISKQEIENIAREIVY